MRSTKQIANANNTIAAFRAKAVETFGEAKVVAGLTRSELAKIKFVHDIKIPSAIWGTKQGEGRGLLFFVPNEIDADEGNASLETFNKCIFLTFGANYNGTLTHGDIKVIKETIGKKNVKVPSTFWQSKSETRGVYNWPIDLAEFEGVPAGELKQTRKEVKPKAVKEPKPEAKARAVVSKAKAAAKKGSKNVKSVTRKSTKTATTETKEAAPKKTATKRKVVVVA